MDVDAIVSEWYRCGIQMVQVTRSMILKMPNYEVSVAMIKWGQARCRGPYDWDQAFPLLSKAEWTAARRGMQNPREARLETPNHEGREPRAPAFHVAGERMDRPARGREPRLAQVHVGRDGRDDRRGRRHAEQLRAESW